VTETREVRHEEVGWMNLTTSMHVEQQSVAAEESLPGIGPGSMLMAPGGTTTCLGSTCTSCCCSAAAVQTG
jgi:hypothetical protein